MFKGKVYLYKNINGKEEKVEKEFNDEKKFMDYVDKNPELKKMEKDFKEIKFPKNFDDMRNFFNDFDKKFFGDISKKNTLFDELSNDFNKLFEKSKKLLDK